MSQPVWKVLHSLGDRGVILADETGVYGPEVELWEEYEPEDSQEFSDDACTSYIDAEDRSCDATRAQHTEGAGGTGEEVSPDACGVFTPESDRTRFLVYRFDLERKSMCKGLFDKDWKVIPYGFHLRDDLPSPAESYEEWFSRDLGNVARSVGAERQELVEALCSADPLERFFAYDAIGGYHGWENFNGYPLDLSEKELEARTEEHDAREKAVKAQRRHRVAEAATTPHGRCAAHSVCVEHAADRRVPSCKEPARPRRRGRGRRSP